MNLKFLMIVIVIFFSPGVWAADDKLPQKVSLKVALYPYIPDAGRDNYQELESRIKKEFEFQNPNITLDLRHINQEDNFYNHDFLVNLLKENHVVEIDNLFLGHLKEQGVISEWDFAELTKEVNFFEEGWLSAAEASLLTEGSVYGIPHWLCGYYIFSRDIKIADARTLEELALALSTSSAKGSKLISTDFKGKWDKVCLYLHAYSTINPVFGNKIGSWIVPLNIPLDDLTLKALSSIAKHRLKDEPNPDQAAISFAIGASKSMIGYSERMHLIERENIHKNDTIYFGNLPFNSRDSATSPAMYVDSFVKSSSLTLEEEVAAVKFVHYMSNPKTVEWMVMSLDVPDPIRIPRYLLPSLESSYSRSIVVGNHHFYKRIYEISKTSISFPQFGIPKVVKLYAEEIEKFIQ